MTCADQFFVSNDPKLLQIDRIHRFLSKEAYWCLGIPKEIVEKAIRSSINFGVYETKSQLQVGYARVVSDRATFAWLCDVYVEQEYRRRGLSVLLMENVVKHKDLRNLRRFCLATKESHFLYQRFGFQVTQKPGSWMEIKNTEVYDRMSTLIP